MSKFLFGALMVLSVSSFAFGQDEDLSQCVNPSANYCVLYPAQCLEKAQAGSVEKQEFIACYMCSKTAEDSVRPGVATRNTKFYGDLQAFCAAQQK